MLRLQRLLKPFVRFIFKVCGNIRIEGLNNLPAKTPYIIFSNHISWFDPPLIGSFFPKPVHFMAMDGLFKFKPLGYLLRLLGAFPVKRGTMDRRAIEEAMDILAREGVVYIFPEGGIKRLSRGEDLRKGISLIAQCTGVPLVPMGITGCRDIYRFWKIFLRRVRITIRIGKPFWLITEPNVSAKKTREKSMQRIKRELCTLAAEEMISH